MKKVHEDDFDYRFDDWGPKYLLKGPNVDIGVVILKPGQDFPNHFHTTCEEVFYVLEGETTFYMNDEPILMQKGDLLQASPGDTHYLVNHSDAIFKAIFIKSPHIKEKDSVTIQKEEEK